MAGRWHPADMTLALGWAGAVPGLAILGAWQAGWLGVVPADAVLHLTGRTALVFLVATLAMGFGHFLTGWRIWYPARRPLGLWTYAYILSHLTAWLMLDQGGQMAFALDEARRMLHVKLGIAALVMLTPIALASTGWTRPLILRLPGVRRTRWVNLLVWPAAIAAIVHTSVVARFENPLVLILGALLAIMTATRVLAPAVRWLRARRA